MRDLEYSTSTYVERESIGRVFTVMSWFYLHINNALLDSAFIGHAHLHILSLDQCSDDIAVVGYKINQFIIGQ